MEKPDLEQLPSVVTDIVADVERYFGDRIVCLLYYGSHAFGGNETDQSDHDFYLLLSRQEPNDLPSVRSIVSSYPVLDFSIHYRDYLCRRGYARFQHGNHGVFFAHYLAISKCLIGTNVFCEIVRTLSPSDVRDSLLFQIEEYFWRLNRWYLYEAHTTELAARMKKYLMRIVIDMMLYHGDLPYECVSAYAHRELYGRYAGSVPYLSDGTKQAIRSSILRDAETGNAVEDLLAVHRKLYLDYLRIVERHAGRVTTRG